MCAPAFQTPRKHKKATWETYAKTRDVQKKRVELDGEVDSPSRQTKKYQDVFTCVFDLNNEMQAKIYTD